jgi:membrane associated rhomboid family serine protease
MNQSFQNPLYDVRNFFRKRSALSYLVIINIAVWLLVQIIKVFAFLFDDPDTAFNLTKVLDYFAVPAYLPNLLTQPWSLFTYMFLHLSIWHILVNMLILYWFGRIFLEYLTERKLIWVYILGGLSGGLVYILSFNIFPVFSSTIRLSYAIGASASVMAVVSAIAFYVPNYTIYLLFLGRVRIIYIAIALFVLDFFMIPSANSGGHIAHIGGALFGFLYIKLFFPSRKSIHGAQNPFISWWKRTFFRPKRTAPKGARNRPVSDEEYNYNKAHHQQQIDKILDKISKGGYDSLTKEEKEFLFKSSGKQ